MARRSIICLVFAVFMATAAQAQASDGFFGVLPQESMSPSAMATAKAGGIESLRLPISRNSVNGSAGEFDWTPVDSFVYDAAKAGLTVLPTFYGTSDWENSDNKWLPNTVTGRARWNEMLTIAVKRYGPNGSFWTKYPEIPKTPITVWQIWNEVNTRWFTPSVVPGDYANLVINSSKVIKAEDPTAKILLAGMFSRPRPEWGMRADEYLKSLYKTPGFRQSFDFAAVHPYEATVADAMEDIADVRLVLDNWGDGGKGIYVTELGWGSDSNSIYGAGSRSAQVQVLTSAYEAILLAKPTLKVLAVYWFTWRDLSDGLATCVFCFENGLFDKKGAPKPSWTALTDVIKKDAAADPEDRTGTGTGTGSNGASPKTGLSKHRPACKRRTASARTRCRVKRKCKSRKAGTCCRRLRRNKMKKCLRVKRARRSARAKRKGGR